MVVMVLMVLVVGIYYENASRTRSDHSTAPVTPVGCTMVAGVSSYPPRSASHCSTRCISCHGSRGCPHTAKGRSPPGDQSSNLPTSISVSYHTRLVKASLSVVKNMLPARLRQGQSTLVVTTKKAPQNSTLDPNHFDGGCSRLSKYRASLFKVSCCVMLCEMSHLI